MNKDLKQALQQAAVLTFEEIGFLYTSPIKEDSCSESALDYEAGVGFEGKFSGILVVRMNHKMLPQLAANMLGEEEPPSDEIQRDALGEIANVICGNALPLIAGKEEIFNLCSPEVVSGKMAASIPQIPAAVSRVGFDEGQAEIKLYLW